MKRLLWPLAVVIVAAIPGAAGLPVAQTAPIAPTASPDTIATLVDAHKYAQTTASNGG